MGSSIRGASHRVTRNDDDGATRSGSRDGISPLGPTNSAGWHAHARVGMSWRCRGAFVVPWSRFAWPCHPTDLQAPLTVIPTEGPKARSGGIRSNSASARYLTPCRSILFDKGERWSAATQRHDATASAVSLRDAEKWVPRSAVLRSASHRVARNDGDGAAPSGSRVAYPRSP